MSAIPTPSDPVEKGHQFEEFVARRFDRDDFVMENNRSDRSIGGHFAESNKDPDFVWSLKRHLPKVKFATECKWRADWFDHVRHGKCLGLGKDPDSKLYRYQEFQSSQSIPVFLIIGQGGEPFAPTQLFIVPLSAVRSGWMTKDFLEKYAYERTSGKFALRVQGQNQKLVFLSGPIPQNGYTPPPRAVATTHREPQLNENAPAISNFTAKAIPTAHFHMPHQGGYRIISCPPNHQKSTHRITTVPKRNKRNIHFSVVRWIVALLIVLGLITSIGQIGRNTLTSTLAIALKHSLLSSPLQFATHQSNSTSRSHSVVASVKPVPSGSNHVSSGIRYKTPASIFQLTIEQVEPATVEQLTAAMNTAQKAMVLFNPSAKPPFFAITTLPSSHAPRLTAYLVFDTQSESFCSKNVLLTVNRMLPRTIAKMQNYECFFLDDTWISDVSGSL